MTTEQLAIFEVFMKTVYNNIEHHTNSIEENILSMLTAIAPERKFHVTWSGGYPNVWDNTDKS